MEKLHIARHREELGTLARSEVCALLEAGFLRNDDEFSTDGGDTWKPLSSLAPDQPRDFPAQLALLKTAASSRLKNLVAAARASSASVASSAEKTSNALRESLLQDYLPRLSEPVARQLNAAHHTAAAALQNDVFLRKLFGAVYDSLPKAVHRFVDEQQFIEFCFKHKKRLLNSEPSPSEPSPAP